MEDLLAIGGNYWAIDPAYVPALSRLGSIAASYQGGSGEQEDHPSKEGQGVAVIPIRGVIFPYANFITEILGFPAADQIKASIAYAVNSPSVSSIVLSIDSPGGSASGIPELADFIREASTRKPIVAHTSSLMASAAYWVASACSEIVMGRTAMAGSIGVIMEFGKDEDGKTISIVSKQSPHKRVSPESKEGRAKYQEIVDALGAEFVRTVAENREVTEDKVLSDFGQGWVKIGQDAVNAGMADRIGSIESLVSELGSGAKPKKSNSGDKPMARSFKEVVASWFSAGMPDDFDANAETGQAETVNAAANASASKTESGLDVALERIRGLEAENAKLSIGFNAATQREAGEWFEAQVKAGKADPSAKTRVIAAYCDFAKLDRDEPLECQEGSVSRLDVLKMVYEDKPAGGVLKEYIPVDADSAAGMLASGGFKVLPTAKDKADAEAEKDREETLALMRKGAGLAD